MSQSDDEKEAQKRLAEAYATRLKDRKRYNTRWRLRRAAVPVPAGEVLGGFFRGDAQALKKIEEQRALLAWEGFVGAAAAQVSAPLRIRGGRLIVQVTDPMWRQQLLLLRHQILSKYRQHFPRLYLKEIFFVAY